MTEAALAKSRQKKINRCVGSLADVYNGALTVGASAGWRPSPGTSYKKWSGRIQTSQSHKDRVQAPGEGIDANAIVSCILWMWICQTFWCAAAGEFNVRQLPSDASAVRS